MFQPAICRLQPETRLPLRLASLGDPFKKTLHAVALTPHQPKEFWRREIGGIFPEESFKPPLQIRRSPRPQAIAFGRDPVVAKSVEHASWQGTTVILRPPSRSLLNHFEIGRASCRERV